MMKIEKSNNPLGVGALILILTGIVGKIGWMLLAPGDTAAAASPAVSIPPAAASPAVASAVPPTAAAPVTALPIPALPTPALPVVTPHSDRNPFLRVIPTNPAPPRPSRAPERPDIPTVTVTPISPLPPLPVVALPRQAPGAAHHPAAQGAAAAGTQDKTGELPALKLTAVVGGEQPMAVLQTTRPDPVILHVGDRFAGMRVVAIHDQDIVFARGEGLWTLPLQSAGDAGAPDPVSVAAATPEENSDGLR